ncbi:MAG TPA: helix-turn-helix transcriptional regulator [Candidatus Limnocylindrales bacterium]|nr:helix-turn-helix transcriptional regulator [Candidatus Limnocylindrales bacterium]
MKPKPLRRQHVEVLELMSRGFTRKQISARMGIPPGTVKDWMGSIQRRLGAQNGVNAVALAMASGVIRGPGAIRVEVEQ